MAVPADRAEACVAALHARGVAHAAIIGSVAEAATPEIRVTRASDFTRIQVTLSADVPRYSHADCSLAF